METVLTIKILFKRELKSVLVFKEHLVTLKLA